MMIAKEQLFYIVRKLELFVIYLTFPFILCLFWLNIAGQELQKLAFDFFFVNNRLEDWVL